MNTREPDATETVRRLTRRWIAPAGGRGDLGAARRVRLTPHARFGKGSTEKVLATGTSPAIYFTGMSGSGRGRRKRTRTTGTSPAAYFTSRSVPWEPGDATSPGHPTVCDFSNPDDTFSNHLFKKWRERQGLE